MKSILLLTDFSKNSLNAIHYAMNLYKYNESNFYIINILKTSSFVTGNLMTTASNETIYDGLVKSTKHQINNLITELKLKYNNPLHRFESIVDYDNFVDSVNQIIINKNIGLIIMGTKGATNINKLLFGSNTVRLMQRSSCPILAIPNNYKFTALNKIGFTSNYLTEYRPNELESLIVLAEKHNAKIEIIHLTSNEDMTEHQKNNRNLLNDCFKSVDHTFINIQKKDLIEAIEQQIKDKNLDMIAMMSRKHSFLERLFIRHKVENYTYKIKIPLLVMENTAKQYTLR